jgi:hypothetical protein
MLGFRLTAIVISLEGDPKLSHGSDNCGSTHDIEVSESSRTNKTLCTKQELKLELLNMTVSVKPSGWDEYSLSHLSPFL